jgi:hypothetical protein
VKKSLEKNLENRRKVKKMSTKENRKN